MYIVIIEITNSCPQNRCVYCADDNNRVVLQPTEGHMHDFVNASYVDVSLLNYYNSIIR